MEIFLIYENGGDSIWYNIVFELEELTHSL